MIEYIHDIIRATAGEVITIGAKLYDDGFAVIDGKCCLTIYDNDNAIIKKAEGTYNSNKEEWEFTLDTENMMGKYWYVINKADTSLAFKQPIYFV